MDAPDGHRRNGSLSTNHPGKQQIHPNYQPYRETQERSPQDHPAMATATLLHPTSSFPPPQPYSYPHHNPSMISPTESRNEDSDSSKRQSLPSISEVISGAKPYAPQQSNVQPSPPASLHSRPTHVRTRSPRNMLLPLRRHSHLHLVPTRHRGKSLSPILRLAQTALQWTPRLTSGFRPAHEPAYQA
uniref:Uncharacterized protein n=1 Tax=Bionectria ochroleuca TaxID=29856 RepID=A0A8H7KBV6_BIOOC